MVEESILIGIALLVILIIGTLIFSLVDDVTGYFENFINQFQNDTPW